MMVIVVYAGVSRITSKGQVTIPVEIRENQGLVEGDQVVFLDSGNGVLMEKTDRLFAVFESRAKELGLSRKQLKAQLEEERANTLKRFEKKAVSV
jgi:antitoxin PrlF